MIFPESFPGDIDVISQKKLLGRIKPFVVSASIIDTIKTSHIVIIVLLLVPMTLSIIVTLLNTISYDRLITNVEKTNRLNQIVKTDITNELWDIVAGNKSFNEGRQYRIIGNIRSQIADIMSTTGGIQNRQLLEVADRSLNTLTRYVDRLGTQMEKRFPVIENERMLDEIRGVSALVSDILQDFIVLEIESTAAQSRRIKTRALVTGITECAIIVFALLFSVFVQSSVSQSVDQSIGSLAALSTSIAEGDLDARAELLHVRELETLALDLNTMAGKIKNLIDENTREQRNLQKSEMRALQAQITPHFLYNTLDSIIWLAEGNKNEDVISITRAFSDFFRISLNRGNEWVRVQDEFKHVESYLTIQKIRYRDILDYSIEYEDVMEQKTILKLLLQPLVDNAPYHGIKNKRGKGFIRVQGWMEKDEEDWLFFSVEDNGIGMTAGQLAMIREQDVSLLPAKSYGLYNVCKRLELYYNLTGLLDIQSVYKEGTKVTLRIPEGKLGLVEQAFTVEEHV
jgi:two-component system sensor histidine kinase YesM